MKILFIFRMLRIESIDEQSIPSSHRKPSERKSFQTKQSQLFYTYICKKTTIIKNEKRGNIIIGVILISIQ